MSQNTMSTSPSHLRQYDRASQRPGADFERNPDFVCFGSQKAGTRWLFDQMNSRDDVWMPPIKEINFLTGRPLKPGNLRMIEQGRGSMPRAPRQGDSRRSDHFLAQFASHNGSAEDIAWYRRLFGNGDDRISGDVSPNYSTANSETVQFAARSLPRTKFIFLVREPVSRFWSQICMQVRRGSLEEGQLDDWSYIKSIMSKRQRFRKSYPSQIWHRWASEIDSGSIRFWFFDDVVQRPQRVVDEICDFLNIATGPGQLSADHNSKKDNKKFLMTDEVRLHLIEAFANELDQCAHTFGSHAIRWRDEAFAVRSTEKAR